MQIILPLHLLPIQRPSFWKGVLIGYVIIGMQESSMNTKYIFNVKNDNFHWY